jgi:hypothetical protein
MRNTLRQLPPLKVKQPPEAPPDVPLDAPTDVTTVYKPPERPRPTAAPAARVPPLELTLIRQQGLSHAEAGREWVAVEIWTTNRIYLVNNQMICTGVINRASRKREAEHALLGALLTGGQRRGGNQISFSQPFPIPGMKALFQHTIGARGVHRFGETSKVERVVVRLGITTINLPETADDEAYAELTARFFIPNR